MGSLVFKHSSYYAVFSSNNKKKWIKLGKINKGEASKLLKQLELEHAKDKLGLARLLNKVQPLLLNDYVKEYLIYCKTNKALSTYNREVYTMPMFISYFRNPLVNELTTKHIEAYKSKRLSNGLAPVSINRELSVLRFMLKKAHEWGYINHVPEIKDLKVSNKPVRFLSQEDMNKLLDCATPWLKPMLIVLRNTGMRVGELLRLRLSDIDMDNKLLMVNSTKTNSHRAIPINSELEPLLKWLTCNYIECTNFTVSLRTSKQTTYLFCHPDGSRIKTIRHSFNNACSKAGIKATIHILRHSFASHLVMNGVDLVSIKELLGHTSINTTMIYSHVSDTHKINSVARLPWLQTRD